jgi:hypothetical protein
MSFNAWVDDDGSPTGRLKVNIDPAQLNQPGHLQVPPEFHVVDTYWDEEDEPWVVFEHENYVPNIVQM